MILRKYLIQQCLGITLLMTVVLLAISMISQFSIYLRAVVAGALDISLLLPLLISFLPQYLGLVLPLSFFIALIITLNRSQSSNELTIMTTCGMSRNTISGMLLPLAVVIFLCSLVLNLFITPYSANQAQEILIIQENLDALDIVTPNTFIRLNDNTDLYTESISEDKKTLDHIYLFTQPNSAQASSQVVYAHQAQLVHIDGRRHIKLRDGYQVSVAPGRADMVRTTFDSMLIRLPHRQQLVRISRKESMSNTELLASSEPSVYQHFFWRVSLALFIPILFIVALYMFITQSRHDSAAKNFLIQFFSCLLYIGLTITVSSLASENKVRPEIAYSAVHLSMAFFVYMFYRRYIRKS